MEIGAARAAAASSGRSPKAEATPKLDAWGASRACVFQRPRSRSAAPWQGWPALPRSAGRIRPKEPSILARGERIAVYLVEEFGPYAELVEPDVIEMRRIMARPTGAGPTTPRSGRSTRSPCSRSAAGSQRGEAMRSGSDPGQRSGPRTLPGGGRTGVELP